MQNQYTARVAYGIENANYTRNFKLSFEKCQDLARQALAEKGTLKSAREWLDAKRIGYNF